MAMGLAISIAPHALFIYHYQRFENDDHRWLRSLPLSLPQRVVYLFIPLAVIHIPELSIVIGHFPSSLRWYEGFMLITFAASCYLLIYACLFVGKIPVEKFIKRIAGAALLIVVCILFRVPVWVMALLAFIAALILLRKHFYTFEFQGDEDERNTTTSPHH